MTTAGDHVGIAAASYKRPLFVNAMIRRVVCQVIMMTVVVLAPELDEPLGRFSIGEWYSGIGAGQSEARWPTVYRGAAPRRNGRSVVVATTAEH